MSDDGFKAPEQNEFGPFGTGVKPVRYPFFAKYSSLVKFVILLLMVPVILVVWYYVYWNYLEQESPFIEITKLPVALGSAGNEMRVRVRDFGTGLKKVEIVLTQREHSRVLLKKEFPKAKDDETFLFLINAKEAGIAEGEASVTVSAQDRSYRVNTSTLPVIFKVDYQPASIELLAGDSEYAAGSSGLVCYRISETIDILSGVTFGAYIFPGLPAKGLHQDFAPFHNIFCAFFPLPLDLAADLKAIRLFVRDGAGNTAGIDLPIKIRPVAPSKTYSAQLPPGKWESLEQELKGKVTSTAFQSAEDKLLPLFVRPKPQAFWQGVFRRLSGDALWVEGDTLQLSGGESALSIRAKETFLRLAARQIVRASAAGIVIYADDLAAHGKTLIVDHGFGVATRYAHLSSFMKREGDRVNLGDELGVAGATGLALEDGYGFSLLVQGMSVRPGDWDDPISYERLILVKLRELRKKLGIREVRILE